MAGIFVALSFVTRLALLLRPDTRVALAPLPLLHIFGVGLLFDLVTAAYFCLPLALYLALLPGRVSAWRPHRLLFAGVFLAFVYGLCVTAVSEWVFWDEFAARFNFIAVDYLIYTKEVLGNIRESYPVGTLFSLLAIPALLLWLPLARPVSRALRHPAGGRERLKGVAPWIVVPLLSFAFVTADLKTLSPLDAENELAGNGIYELFAAYLNNSLDYERFYATLPHDQAMKTAMAAIPAGEGRWLHDRTDSIQRTVLYPGPEKRLNIVLVSVESLGAEFLGAFGNPDRLTPNLDALAGQGLFFTNVFATGNRTVRGLEALSLSIPPTPGQSIVRRPKNEGLVTLGAILEDKGYDTRFLYGGYGYFDNMKYFFSNNDYTVVDRSALAAKDIHYENIWGVADEDLYTLTLRELDRSWRDGRGKRPFFAHVMTTSNHRPYSYPAGRIDIPSGTGRSGAVKYTDYAIGEFLRQARSRPWFADTVFVLTADHGASARGTVNIPIEKYRIPVIVWSPAHIKPQRIDRLASQIDIPPTLMGLLNSSYTSKFYGHDVMRSPAADDRAFVANYQTLGYMKAGRLVTLQPKRKVGIEPLPAALGLPADPGGVSDDTLRREAIGQYMSAAYVFRNGLYKDEERNLVAAR
jgi:phosphoglycerol transferase MdoB-like AlkP superfamily enzyme